MGSRHDWFRSAFERVRQQTRALAAPLSAEDCCAQSMTDASPVKWHLGHTTWFFETFILEKMETAFRPFHPAYRVLFNSYYNGVGEKHPRPERGMLTRPSLEEVLAYRRHVDEHMLMLLSNGSASPELAALLDIGLHHEQQHQELILTDVKHLLSRNPLNPAYVSKPLEQSPAAGELGWRTFDGGVVEIGHTGEGFFFDNEAPRHREFLEPFSLATRLVTNGEFAAFIDDGGYANPALWLSEGWDWVQADKLTNPVYWRRGEAGWQEFTLHGLCALDPNRPALHLSFFEAEAFARWQGARLPTEAEWEHAAADATGFGSQGLHPASDLKVQSKGLSQLFGAAWQWTLSSYAPYPGYQPAVGAIGEYNGKFMSNQYVLRGSSCATPTGHARVAYRNFFPATARWQFSGIRLARSV